MKPYYAELEKRVAELERKVSELSEPWINEAVRKAVQECQARAIQDIANMARRGGAYSKAVRG